MAPGIVQRILRSVFNGLWLGSNFRHSRDLEAAFGNPELAQWRVLRNLVERNAETLYGTRYGFIRIMSPAQFQDRVPVATYEDLAPWIEQIKDGRHGVLTRETVLMLEKTGGSTSAAKYIPYTSSLRQEFNRAVAAWMYDLYSGRPGLLTTGAYWSISPTGRHREVTRGGVPVGFTEDTEYFDWAERLLLGRLLVVPGALAHLEDMETCRFITLRYMLAARHLGFISVWNPTFLTRLMEELERQAGALVESLESGEVPGPAREELARGCFLDDHGRLPRHPARAHELDGILRRYDCLRPELCWPELKVISCWTSGVSRRFVPGMSAFFPRVEVQAKGLLATEGVVSIPLLGHSGAALAVTSHFLEFIPASDAGARPHLAHELEAGERYTVLLTTGGGLYRYRLDDEVEVVGRIHKTPLIEFIGRAGNVSDMCGEKLAESFVGRVLEAAIREEGLTCSFAMIAPELGNPPHYWMFMDLPEEAAARLPALVRAVERGLSENPQYAYCRRLGQLGSLQGIRLDGRAQARYLAACENLGQRSGNVKPAYLRRETSWREWLGSGP